MELLTLPEIKAQVDRRAKLVGAPADSLPSYGQTRDFGYPHIEVDSRGYHYIIVERGVELKRVTTADLNDLLYEVFQAVAFSIAGRYAVKHRVGKQDFRRSMFKNQVDVLASLNPQWAERCAQRHLEILGENPFVDG